MTALGPGVLCDIVQAPCAPVELVGMRCTIIGSGGLLSLLSMIAGVPGHELFLIQLQDGREVVVCGTCLRPIEPPKEKATTWDSVEKLTGWAPPVKEVA